MKNLNWVFFSNCSSSSYIYSENKNDHNSIKKQEASEKQRSSKEQKLSEKQKSSEAQKASRIKKV